MPPRKKRINSPRLINRATKKRLPKRDFSASGVLRKARLTEHSPGNTSTRKVVKTVYLAAKGRVALQLVKLADKEAENAERDNSAPGLAASTPVLPIHEGIVEITQRDVMQQLRNLQPRFEGGLPSKENLVFAYTHASTLRVDEDEWQIFCMAPEWKRRKKRPDLSEKDRTEALLYVLRFLCGTGPNASVPVKQGMNLLRPFWESDTTPYDLHETLMQEAPPVAQSSIAVRVVDDVLSRQLLAMPPGTAATVTVTMSRGKRRNRYLLALTGFAAEPL